MPVIQGISEDWWYPSYMNDLCPGLPDWKALDACAELFATAETAPKGRFVGPPADWGKHYSERIQALGMNYEEVAVGQAATLWAELQAAYDRQEPIVLFNWTPNFIEAKFDGEFVVFPEYDPACLTDPAWGMNPDAVYDCGAPASGYLKKAGSPRLAETWPAAYAFLQNVDFSNDQIAAAADAKAGWVMAPTNEVIRNFLGRAGLLGFEALDLWNQEVNQRAIDNEIKKMTPQQKAALAERLLA